MILRIEDVSVRFGGVVALSGVSFDCERGTCLGIVGPNGAGKSTLLNAISGLVSCSGGRIWYDGDRDLLRRPPHERARLGIARTFQHSRLFSGLTTTDQLLCGGFAATRYPWASGIVRSPGMVRAERSLLQKAEKVLDLLGITEVARTRVEDLSGPFRRLVDLGRALMTDPRLLLVDEIAAGQTDEEKSALIRILDGLRTRDGVSLLVIEHDLQFVRTLSQRVTVLAEGQVLASGQPDQVLARSDVLRAYVGDDEKVAQ